MLLKQRYAEIIETYKKIESQIFLQENFYYDTSDFYFFNRENTLRVRKKDDKLLLQYKYDKSTSGGIRLSKEYSREINQIPSTIILGDKSTYLLGSLITKRMEIKYEDAVICLDLNYYLGIVDYELEIETENMQTIERLIKKWNLDRNKVCGKYSRFVKKISELKPLEIDTAVISSQ